MSWRVTLGCTRAEAESLPDSSELFPEMDLPPVLVADEPDPDRPDEWRIHVYFDGQPGWAELAAIERLAADSDPAIERLEDADWVSLSQQGLEPIRAGRFFVHTPMHYKDRPDGALSFEIDAGLAFGTGQHATTAGCLEALDRLEANGARFRNIADIGTGTGLLAFAALALWPEARAIATDIDSQAIDVARDNAAINGIRLGHGPGELLLSVADGMDDPMLEARAPYDLLIANILAGPLVALAPDFAAAVAHGGTILLAGLLESQAETVIAAYAAHDFRLVDPGAGEWRVLVLEAPSQSPTA